MRAVGGGGAPDLRRPSQRRKASPPGTPFRHPQSAQRRPARAHAVGKMQGPQARTNRTRDTRVAEPRLPAPEDGQSGEGQCLTRDAPHSGGRPPPRATAPRRPRGTQPPQGMQATGTVLGPHTRTPPPTARGWRTPTGRPEGGQSGEGERLTSDTPHNGGKHAPGYALPPPLQCATPARKGARCGAGAGSPRPHQPHPGHTGRGTPAACPRGGAVGGGTAPHTRHPSQRWQATPPGDGPPPPLWHAVPTGHASQGDSAGPPHPQTRAQSTWVADPDSPPGGRAVGGGGAPDLRRPSQRRKASPPGTPFRHPQSAQRRPARAHAVGKMQGPQARTNRTRDTRVAEPRLPAPEDGQSGEGQRLTRDAPHSGGRPPPRATAPRHPRGTQPPQGMQATGTVLGTHSRTPPPTARGWRTPTGRPEGGQSGEGERLTSDAPHNGGKHAPGYALPPPLQCATPARKGARCGAGAGSPRPHQPHPGHTGRGTPAARPRGGAVGGGTAPDTRRPSQRWQATPPGDGPPPAPRHAAPTGTVLGPHTRTPAPTARGWRTPTARPEGGQSGEGERLTSDAPHNGERHPARGRPSATTTIRNAGPQGRMLWGRCRVPTPTQTAPGTQGSRNPGCLPQGAGRGTAPDTRRLSQRWRAIPPGDGPPPPPWHAAPTGHASQGDSAGPPHPHTRAHSTWVVDADSPPRGRAAGGGGAPDLRRPAQRRKAPPPGRPSRQPHSAQRRPTRAHAVGPVLGRHAHNNRARDTRVAEPRLSAPEDGRPGEGQRLTPDAPHNGGRPAPQGTAPHHPRGTQPPQGMQAKGTVLGPHTITPAPTASG